MDKGRKYDGGHNELIEDLTERELEVLRLLRDGKSNAEIAEALFVQVSTVKWYNTQIYGKLSVKNRKGAAKRADELGLFETAMETASVKTITLHNLPTDGTPFIGRELEIVEIVELLRDDQCRLLTLVGPGGMGKTRLAVEAVRHLTNADFEHSVYYVPLAPLTSVDNIVTTVIGMLGIVISDGDTPQQELVKFLNRRNLLLVMDNFEHVLEGTELIADILSNTPNVKVLVTSREALNLRVERIWQVRGMRFPSGSIIDDLEQYSALKLFIDRATWVSRDFSIDNQLDCVVRICQLVDGMPLGIELAASWLKSLACADIIQEIESGIDFLTTRTRDVPERHRSIRAVFDHSWDLLTTSERKVFPRLSVFRGGFTRDAAKYVAEADLMTLAGLVEKSMVRRDASGRYDIHELLRQYGEEQLVRVGKMEATRTHHAQYFAKFPSTQIDEYGWFIHTDSAQKIIDEYANLRVAWLYLVQHGEFDLFTAAPERYIRALLHTTARRDGVTQFEQFVRHLQDGKFPDHDYALGCAYTGLSMLNYDLDADAAITCANQAISILDKYPARVISLYARFALAEGLGKRERYADALAVNQDIRDLIAKYNLPKYWITYAYTVDSRAYQRSRDYDNAFLAIKTAMDLTPIDHPSFIHRLVEVALTEVLRKNYHSALKYLSQIDSEALIIAKDYFGIETLILRVECFIALHDPVNARRSVVQVLRFIHNFTIQYQLQKLPRFFRILFRYKLLSLDQFITTNAVIHAHPEANPNMKESIENEMSKLQSESDHITIQNIWERGKKLNLKTVIRELLEEFSQK